jgi:long-subunit fatty acid transport protein
MKVRDNFSVGVSAFVSVYNFKGNYDLRLASLDEAENVNFYDNIVRFGQSSYGMFWKVGLAWKLRNFDLGLNIDLPYLEVIKSGKFGYGEFLSGYGGGDDIYILSDFNDLESKRKEPLAISFGAGIPWKKNTIHLKVDWHGAISEYDRLVIPSFESGTGQINEFRFKEELKSVINFGLGLEFYLNEKLNLFASFSTDFSPIETNANIFDLVGNPDRDINIEADYMHYGLGLDFKLKRVNITVGTTYSTAKDTFDSSIDFPTPGEPPVLNEDPSEIQVTRWRFIVGLEFPIFGFDVNLK